MNRDKRYIVGMMSGTSVDGIDAALVEISGDHESPKVRLLEFDNSPFPESVREKIFELFDPAKATVDKTGYMNFLLGELYAQAALKVIEKAGMKTEDIYAIASHGQTIWHEPAYSSPDGIPVHYTVQIGEGSVIAQRTGITTVTDFRTADMTEGGQGAPLVPFTEYLLYRKKDETVMLQNIGGIGNITVMPAGCGPESVFAFDTGPGNMIIDAVVSALSGGKESYDKDGKHAFSGKVIPELLAKLQEDPYYAMKNPKSTGREHFGVQYTAEILKWKEEHGASDDDVIATVTDLTAWSIADAYEKLVMPEVRGEKLIVGGGGGYNPALMKFISDRMAPLGVEVCTQEDAGNNSDAKEAVAFALLADRTMAGLPGNLPSVTGAKRQAVLGKISYPWRQK